MPGESRCPLSANLTPRQPHPAGEAVPLPKPLLMCDREAAAMIGISRAHFHRLRAAGKFGPPAIRLGRKVMYEREAVALWVKAGCPDASTWRAMQGQGQRIRHRAGGNDTTQ
jgi:predicted DNA-binding transcriptional regulator AlpA